MFAWLVSMQKDWTRRGPRIGSSNALSLAPDEESGVVVPNEPKALGPEPPPGTGLRNLAVK
jgi:hypothetical protein